MIPKRWKKNDLSDRLAECERAAKQREDDLQETINSLRAQNTKSNERITSLENADIDLRTELVNAQRTAKEKEDDLNHMITSLRAQNASSNEKMVDLDATIQEIGNQLSDAEWTAKQKEDDLNEIIASLRAQNASSDEKIANFENSDHELRTELAEARRTAKEKEDDLNETITSLRAQNADSNEKIASLDTAIHGLNDRLADAEWTAKQKEDDLNEIIASLRAQNADLVHLEKTDRDLRTQLANSQHETDSLTKALYMYQRKHQCEVLYAENHVVDAAQLFLEIVKTARDGVKVDSVIRDWLSAFTPKCVTALERIGDEATKTEKHDEALAAYSTALSLGPSTSHSLIKKWASTMLRHSSTNETLDVATKFELPRFMICCAICDILERDGRITEAVRCFRQMPREVADMDNEQAQWERGFKERCRARLEELADVAMGSHNYNIAAEHYSTILSLDPEDRVDTLLQRSEVRAMINLWEDALKDADEAIKLDPSSYRGYQQRFAALLGAGRHAEADEALEAFQAVLSKFE